MLNAGLGILSSGLNFVSSAMSNKKAYKYQSQLMNQQYNLQRQLNQNAYQDTTYSMRQAGINPMLAIMNGAQGGSASGVGFNSTGMDLGSGVNTALAKKQLDNETNVAKSTEKLNTSNSAKSEKELELVKEELKQLKEFGPIMKKAEIGAVTANTAKTYQDTVNSIGITGSTIKNLDAQTKNINENPSNTPSTWPAVIWRGSQKFDNFLNKSVQGNWNTGNSAKSVSGRVVKYHGVSRHR